MNNRPKRTDDESDILEMQRAFIKEKAKNTKFEPAAKLIKVDREKKQSLFAKSRKIKGSTSRESKPVGLSNIVLGDIVEKSDRNPISQNICLSEQRPDAELGFPKVERVKEKKNAPGKSLFAMSMERKRHQEISSGTEDRSVKILKETFGERSSVVEEDETAKLVHDENIEMLSKITREAILEERAQLLSSMDPNLVKFLADKRKQRQEQNSFQTKLEIFKENNLTPMETDEPLIEEIPAEEILDRSAAEKWVHFDVIEKEKMEWMKDVPLKIAKLKSGEKFEARFDWKGVLLPYTEENITKDNRELYLHGDEPYRPGYTLQELFRLARSNIMQQRVSAFGSIAGILNIYNQGFYDNVLELPISQIFFLLRFGFDENAPAILEVVSKALSTVFYNDTDETILDLISESSEGYLQPIMDVEDFGGISSISTDNLENSLRNLKLTSSPFAATIQENDEENKTSMNDFQLAETDLIECLLRTNIIQRISYVLGTVRPENSTVSSCIKILIRIARTNKNAAVKILENDELIETLFTQFLPKLHQIGDKDENSFYGFPQYLVLKLFRVLMCQQLSLCLKLLSWNLLDHLRSYLFTRDDMKAKLIKVQIESFRIIRALMLLRPDVHLYKELLLAFRHMLEWHYQDIIYNQGGSFLIRQHAELLLAFRYMLEWHYKNIIYKQGGPFLIRQHASALLGVISSGSSIDAKSALGEALFICSCKWFHEATQYGIHEFSQSILLSSALNCVAWCLNSKDSQFNDFIEKYLRKFLGSKSFLSFQHNLSRSSILLKMTSDRRNVHPPLPNLGSILQKEGSPQLIIPQTYPVFLLNSLFKVIERLLLQNDRDLVIALMQSEMVEAMIGYLKEMSSSVNKKIATNFLVKNEILLVFKLLCFDYLRPLLGKENLLQTTYNILKCMTSEHIAEIEILFETVIFSGDNFPIVPSVLANWRQIYLETFVYPHRVVIPATEISLSMPCSKVSILPSDWPFVLLKSLLNKYLQQLSETSVVVKDSDFPEDEVIRITLSFTALLERNGLEITSPTEKLMYLMIAFMGPDSQFLQADMKLLLREHVSEFFNRYKDYEFQFGGTFEGKSKFENLYVLFLDHFQAASYGDDLFSSLVMVPLAQKYDPKWRKMVWSEHAAVLRFLNCQENQLLGSLQAYLYPDETDTSLIKSYVRALNSNLLRENTIPFKIAVHHVNSHKEQKT